MAQEEMKSSLSYAKIRGEVAASADMMSFLGGRKIDMKVVDAALGSLVKQGASRGSRFTTFNGQYFIIKT